MKLTIISKKLIKPSSPTPDYLRCYKRSFFDQVAVQSYVPCVFFYPPDSTHNDDLIDNVIANRNKRLEESLSKVLSYFPPIAGRFADDLLSVDCNDEGIPYVTAKVDCKLSDFLEKWNENLEVALALGSQITEDNAKIYTSPLAGVQVTFFECGGFGLFINTCHAVMDGFTSMSFIYAWAEVSSLGNIRRSFSFDNGSAFPARYTSAILKNPQFPKKDKEKLVGKRFLFEEDAISELIDKAGGVGPINFQPTRVEVITSLIWRALIRVMREMRGGDSRPSIMLLLIDLRRKIGGGFFSPSTNSFGTMVIGVPMKAEPVNNKDMELHDLVKLMRETKEKTIEACAKSDSDELFSMAFSSRNEIIEWEDNGDQVDLYTATGLCNFPLYGSDFGWGSPVSAHFGLINGPVVWLYNTKRGKGIEAQVDLAPSVMCKFQQDSELIPYLRTHMASE